MSMPYLDKTTPEDIGRINHIGTDKNGNEVYVLGTKAHSPDGFYTGLVALEDVSDEYVFVGTSPYVNNVLRVGGWLSRGASLPALGRPLVISGLRTAYPKLCSLVDTVRLKQEGTMP